MSEEQYGIRQGGSFVAKVSIGPSEDRALSEAMHYLAVYAQDGPVELWKRSKHRRWKPTNISARGRMIITKDPTP
ncbi:hypothetical protein [Sphingomonas sp. TREG-RG-20F-R18-01]|uniref:hypothetical protein n=1 Tax=Sphingomonas sp. TREG-RG-20F-R18-01 TaxID=2914982 RepID=UPI001F5A7A03|nr:hypothetical protein [Sphingomonas sp. TREG-RG-20F-R18-01]